tara:strand:+ start:43 stop:156 length:114 start_codon:yes stop_codon:yes gene_type:complete
VEEVVVPLMILLHKVAAVPVVIENLQEQLQAVTQFPL